MEHQQMFLYIKKGRKSVRSRAFDFEAMCLIDDNRNATGGLVKATVPCLFYMFAETKITPQDIRSLPAAELTALCGQLFLWHRQILLDTAHTVPRKSEADLNFHLRDMYPKLFAAFGILPDALAHQNPYLLLYALQGNAAETEQAPISAEMKMLYGL